MAPKIGAKLDAQVDAKIDAARARLVRALGDSKVVTDPAVLESYAGDASGEAPVLPGVVVRAERASDVVTTLAIASERGVAVTPRGAGTGKSGGAIPVRGGIVLSLVGMDQIVEIDRHEQIVTVEPGLVLGALFAAVEAEGLFYGPDPNSWPSCTLGGNLAENAAGPRSLKYGVTRDWVLGLDVVTADGRRLTLGRRTKKGVTGYDLTSMIVGSEGTLAVVLGATLRLMPKPEAVATLLARFANVEAACQGASALIAGGVAPRCIEMMDGACLAAMRAEGFTMEGGGLLVIELDVDCERQSERAGEILADHAIEILVAQNEAQRERFWSVRRELSHTTRRLARDKISEDVVVPRRRLAELVREVERIGEREAITMLSYGHAGDGNLHVNLLWNGPDEAPRVERAVEALMRAVIAMGGTLSGEHGIGSTKARFLALEQSAPLIALQRDLKRVFDPKGILNPGKIFAGHHRAC